jgi:hypothetical protein
VDAILNSYEQARAASNQRALGEAPARPGFLT